MKYFWSIIHIAAWPVKTASHALHVAIRKILPVKVRRHHVTISCGTVVMFVGVGVAKSAHYCSGFWIIVVDATGYTIHALGAAPIVGLFCRTFKIDQFIGQLHRLIGQLHRSMSRSISYI